MCVCVCVCVCARARNHVTLISTRTDTRGWVPPVRFEGEPGLATFAPGRAVSGCENVGAKCCKRVQSEHCLRMRRCSHTPEPRQWIHHQRTKPTLTHFGQFGFLFVKEALFLTNFCFGNREKTEVAESNEFAVLGILGKKRIS